MMMKIKKMMNYEYSSFNINDFGGGIIELILFDSIIMDM